MTFLFPVFPSTPVHFFDTAGGQFSVKVHKSEAEGLNKNQVQEKDPAHRYRDPEASVSFIKSCSIEVKVVHLLTLLTSHVTFLCMRN